MDNVKLLTLVIPRRGSELLLGHKLRGFGEGYVNGFGGKVEPGETVDDCATRELLEEAGIEATQMDRRGVLRFEFDDQAQPWEVHVYEVAEFRGEPMRTDEMAPFFVDAGAVPFDRMWADDVHWYPHFLSGKLFSGVFRFTKTTTLLSHEVTELDQLPAPPPARAAA